MFIKKIEKKNYGCNKVLIKKFYSDSDLENKDINIIIDKDIIVDKEKQLYICIKCNSLYTLNDMNKIREPIYSLDTNKIEFGLQKCRFLLEGDKIYWTKDKSLFGKDCNKKILYFVGKVGNNKYLEFYKKNLLAYQRIIFVLDLESMFLEAKLNEYKFFNEEMYMGYLEDNVLSV
jgi:hypothetical protein